METVEARATLKRVAREMLACPSAPRLTKLEEIAGALDVLDSARGVEGETDMQDDLRRWSRELAEAIDALYR